MLLKKHYFTCTSKKHLQCFQFIQQYLLRAYFIKDKGEWVKHGFCLQSRREITDINKLIHYHKWFEYSKGARGRKGSESVWTLLIVYPMSISPFSPASRRLILYITAKNLAKYSFSKVSLQLCMAFYNIVLTKDLEENFGDF